MQKVSSKLPMVVVEVKLIITYHSDEMFIRASEKLRKANKHRIAIILKRDVALILETRIAIVTMTRTNRKAWGTK